MAPPSRIILVPASRVQRVSSQSISSRSSTPSTSYSPSPSPQDGYTRRIDPEALLNPTTSTKPRKRERLTSLTPEEKLARRKMKNRVAAQTARDRKKERTHGLEDAIRDLLEENKRLKSENELLHRRLNRLEGRQDMNRVEMKMDIQPSVDTTLGSAVSINDLQQRAQAVSTMKESSTLQVTQLILFLLLSYLPKTSHQYSKILETLTSIKCVPIYSQMKKDKVHPQRLKMKKNIHHMIRLHRILKRKRYPP